MTALKHTGAVFFVTFFKKWCLISEKDEEIAFKLRLLNNKIKILLGEGLGFLVG